MTPQDTSKEAVEALLNYQQADEEGVMVLASRQALHEVIDQLAEARAEIARLRNVAAEYPRADGETVTALVEALREANAAVNDAYSMAYAEWNGHDRRGAKLSNKIEEWRTKQRTALAAFKGVLPQEPEE